ARERDDALPVVREASLLDATLDGPELLAGRVEEEELVARDEEALPVGRERARPGHGERAHLAAARALPEHDLALGGGEDGARVGEAEDLDLGLVFPRVAAPRRREARALRLREGLALVGELRLLGVHGERDERHDGEGNERCTAPSHR